MDPPGVSANTLDYRRNDRDPQQQRIRRVTVAHNTATTTDDRQPHHIKVPSTSSNRRPPPRRVAITPEEETSMIDGKFAVRSIRRGTSDWLDLVRPFVADLAFCSVVSRHFNKRQPLFRPFTTQAAVLFVDISGYSRIAAILADRGAHALSTAVNSYLRRILQIVHQHGGDIVKFAGDAVLCLWYDSRDMALRAPILNSYSFISNIGQGNNAVDETLRYNILSAALCAVELQKHAGSHAVDGTDQEFRIHAGLCHGIVESEIFVAQTHTTMQRMYHLVGGEALEEIGDLVDYAKAGQVCVSAEVHQCLLTFSAEGKINASFQPATDYKKEDPDKDEQDDEEAQLLIDLTIPTAETRDELENFAEEAMITRINKRIPAIAEDFIHSAVLDLLSHGGLSPTQIAQMRDLVVLFIAQTSHGSPANWLLEVQAVLDRNQCPLLQIVDDDKGVHAIAAVNAVAAVPESRLVGLEICRQLVNQKIGVAIGVAAGVTFCGVTGSSAIACRWDITGEPPVRAARLMQYALKQNVPMALDESLCIGPTIPARMAVLEDNVRIKGSQDPIRIYTLSDATEFAAMNLLESVHGEIHNKEVDKIKKYISKSSRHRSAVIVTGPTLAGKKIVCQRAAGFSGMVPFLHVCDSSYGLLQLAGTIAKWFKYVDHGRVSEKAQTVLAYMNSSLFSRAHDECLALVDEALEAGFTACFVVDRVQFLDAFSVSLIRECLHGRKYRTAVSTGPTKFSLQRPSIVDDLTNAVVNGDSSGRITFLCVHTPFYNAPDAASVAGDITRSHRSLSVPVIRIQEATVKQFRELTSSMLSVRFDDKLLYHGSAAAGACAGYFIERGAAINQMEPGRLRRGEKPLVVLRDDLVFCIPPGSLREYRSLSVMKIGSEIAMRYAHIYDELPPIMQVFCKVLGVVSRTDFYWVPRRRVWEVMNDLIAEGVTDETMSILLEELAALYLIRVWTHDGVNYVKFQSPGISDIALDVCTPEQVESIANLWISRLQHEVNDNFRVHLVLAWLHVLINPCKKCKHRLAKAIFHWQQGYRAMLWVSKEEQWEVAKLNRWKELIAAEIDTGNHDEKEILGSDFSLGTAPNIVSFDFLGVVVYRGPIGMGPLGDTLSVIAEQIVSEVRSFDSSSTNFDITITSAVNRYNEEVKVVEGLLSHYNLGQQQSDIQDEMEFLAAIAKPAGEKSQTFQKGSTFSVFVHQYVESRLERLRSLTVMLDRQPVPSFVTNCTCDAIKVAYQVMFVDTPLTQASQVDCAQHALMVLATHGWVPRATPEPMRHIVRQSVARLRNAVVRRLSEDQLHYTKHKQSAVDLKAFLLITALLFDAQDTGKYLVMGKK